MLNSKLKKIVKAINDMGGKFTWDNMSIRAWINGDGPGGLRYGVVMEVKFNEEYFDVGAIDNSLGAFTEIKWFYRGKFRRDFRELLRIIYKAEKKKQDMYRKSEDNYAKKRLKKYKRLDIRETEVLQVIHGRWHDAKK